MIEHVHSEYALVEHVHSEYVLKETEDITEESTKHLSLNTGSISIWKQQNDFYNPQVDQTTIYPGSIEMLKDGFSVFISGTGIQVGGYQVSLSNHNHDDKYAHLEHVHNEYATKEELEQIPTIDTSNFATKEELSSKADASHTHWIMDVEGLEDQLNSKADINHTHSEYALTEHVHEHFDTLDVDNFTCNGNGHVYLNDSQNTCQIKPGSISLNDFDGTHMTQISKEKVSVWGTNAKFEINGVNLIDIIYPIGSIYTSVNETNPNELFGGTWEQIVDRFLYCTSSGGETGGSKTLTVDNLPSHNHNFTGDVIEGNFGFAADTGIGSPWSHYINSGPFTTTTPTKYRVEFSEALGYSFHFEATPSGTISNTGSGTDYMPPYITVYAWKRTA